MGIFLHLWATGDNNDACAQRFPQIEKVAGESKGLQFRSCVNGSPAHSYLTGGNGDGLVLMDWYEIVVGQRQIPDGRYRYYINIRFVLFQLLISIIKCI